MDFIRKYKDYVFTTAAAFLVSVLIALSRGIFRENEMDEVLTILSDAFFIPGVLFIGTGLIIYASNEGLFLSVLYGFKAIGRTITAKKDEKLMEEKYHEYYARQMEKKSKWKHFVMVGIAFVVISFLFVAVY